MARPELILANTIQAYSLAGAVGEPTQALSGLVGLPQEAPEWMTLD